MNIKLKDEYALNKTGLTYDPIMLEYHCEWDPIYPEKPDRILKPYERCKFYNLVDKCVDIKGRFATDEEVEVKHTKRVNELMKESETMNRDELIDLSKKYDSMYWHNATNKAARWALGSSLEMLDNILTYKIQNGFAIIRPPGHHAMHDEPNGYCYFNNAAICAKVAIDKYKLKRVLIVDWDVHHGQGIQRMFYDDPNVLYFSIHRYDNGNFWPNLRESDFDYIGEGAGKGFNINVPLNKIGFNNTDYMAIFNNILLPIAYEFNPELVIVSSGYDSCIGCFEGRMKVTPSCYAHFINVLSCLANGKLCVLLEGGYCIKSLSEGVALTLRALLGYPCPRLDDFTKPDPMIVEVIHGLKSVLRPYWCCLQNLNEINLNIELEEYLAKFEEKRKDIKFYTDETKPEEFQLTGFYPLYTDDENRELDVAIDKLIENTDLSWPKKRTSICSDDRMMLHSNLVDSNHPEKPDRIKRIMDTLRGTGVHERCEKLKSREATLDELKLCHSEDYIDSIKELENKTRDELYDLSLNPHSVYYHSKTFVSACLATGCLLEVVDAVCFKKCTNGVAVIRPPGHHAFEEKSSGFCFFNSIAIAARYACKKFNKKKILILDWDVHHGNGTQDIIQNDESVLFISLHRYDCGCYYPCHAPSNYDNIGKGERKGRIVNIPWSEKTMGNSEYISAFLQIVMPIAYEFNPDLVLVSSGFDAALGDPLGNYKITPAGFAHMLKMLCGLANGNVILALEGGYNLTSISDCMNACVSVLLGDSVPDMPPVVPKEEATVSIRNVVSALKPYWNCFQFDEKLPKSECIKKIKYARTKDQNNAAKIAEPSYSLRSRTRTGNNNINENAPVGACASPLKTSDAFSIDLTEFHAVIPLTDCPHLVEVKPLKEEIDVHRPCKECDSKRENWICLTCYQVFCSRFVKSHMVEHYEKTKHSMVLSFSDLSFWCYSCDAYITNSLLDGAKTSASISKFGE